MCQIKLATKRIFWVFDILKNNRIMPFCNLFIVRPSYKHRNRTDHRLYHGNTDRHRPTL